MKNDELALKLCRRLREVYDNDLFFLAILTYAEHPDDQKAILDFIDTGEDVDDETVSVLAMELSDARESKQFSKENSGIL